MSKIGACLPSAKPLPPLRRLARARDGATAVEAALVWAFGLLPMLFGIIEAGHLMWTQTVLYIAVQEAARCASVNTTTCSNQAAVQTYAQAHSWGMTIPASTFTLTTPSCGYQVAANYAFTPIVGFFPISIHLGASACFPSWS